MPHVANVSSVRGSTPTAFECSLSASLSSSTTLRTPWRASPMASARPTGPAPAMPIIARHRAILGPTNRLGVAFSGGLPPADIVECINRADDLGYESAWVAEGHGGDQFAILGACAVATRRILLGTSISSVFVRSAPTIAMAAATVDELSRGRFLLGLGSSHRVQVEPEHGIPFVQPTKRLRETIDLTRMLLRDGVVSYRGDVIDVARFDLWFPPFRPDIPIYVAALFPTMLETSGALAD